MRREKDVFYGATDDITVGVEAGTGKAILIKVLNAGELARAQGAVASLAQTLVPGTVENKVLETMKDKLSESLRNENVAAEVSIVQSKNYAPKSSSNGLMYLGIAAGGLGLVGALWYLTRK